MQLFKETRILYTFIIALTLWVLLPATTKTTANTGYIQLGTGYAPVVNFNRHPNPPKIGSRIFKHLVWRHERYSILWLPFWGSKTGKYGLFKKRSIGRARSVVFVPLTFAQAQKYAATVNVNLNPSPPISYWSLYFGWMVMVPLVLIYYWDSRFYRKLSDFL